jgi:hypothetical protein
MKENNESKQNTYVVEWQEIVTYSVEVEAESEEEAQYLAQEDYGCDNEVHSNYYDGSIHIERVQD